MLNTITSKRMRWSGVKRRTRYPPSLADIKKKGKKKHTLSMDAVFDKNLYTELKVKWWRGRVDELQRSILSVCMHTSYTAAQSWINFQKSNTANLLSNDEKVSTNRLHVKHYGSKTWLKVFLICLSKIKKKHGWQRLPILKKNSRRLEQTCFQCRKNSKSWQISSWSRRTFAKWKKRKCLIMKTFKVGLSNSSYILFFRDNVETHMKNSGDEGLLSLLDPFSLKPLLISFSYFSLYASLSRTSLEISCFRCSTCWMSCVFSPSRMCRCWTRLNRQDCA